MNIRQFVSNMTPKSWAMIGGAAAAVILFLLVVMNVASSKSYSTMLTGLDPAQTGKITSTLDAKGIGYQIQNGGTALAVDSSQVSQARIALATGGLLSNQQPGFSLFDKSQLGASNFQQQITYQRALEGQLDSTIQQIQGVDSAQVNLVLPNPQQQLFADNSQPSSASVLISNSGNLDPSAVRGIANLVSSSVPGLQLSKVTITDGTGQLLWPTSAAGGAGGATTKQAADNQYDAQIAAQATTLLAQTLGPGKAQVVVNADVNADQASSDALVYAKKGVPLTQQSQTETLKGGGSNAGGTTGTIPAYAASGGSSNSNYQNKSSNTTFGVNKTVTHTTIAPGAVNNQTVSVLVDKSVPASAIPAIKSAVAGAVGLNAKRGDSLSISQIAFAKPAATTASPTSPTKLIGYAKYGAIGLGTLLFLFFMRRNLKRRERESFGQPTWLRELETPRPLAALAAGVDDEPTEVKRLRSPVNVPKRQVEELVDRDPDRVAQQVRAWMDED